LPEIVDLLARVAGRVKTGLAQPRIGIVSSTSATTATAKVVLQPEGVLTGWLPVLASWAGNGWGISCPVSNGDQVLIIFLEGSVDAGIIVGRLFSSSARPPSAQAGGLIIADQSGASISLSNNGTVTISGDLYVSGHIFDSGVRVATGEITPHINQQKKSTVPQTDGA